MRTNEPRSIAQELVTHGTILFGMLALMWVIEIIDQLTGQRLDRLGIWPRMPFGLRGILFAPFLHGGFGHLLSNTVPFLVLGWLVMLREISDFFIVTAIAMVVGGLGTWVFGAPGVHIGASGVIFGYLGFLLLRGYFERSMVSITFSLIVGALYGSLIWGVLPTQIGISWEGHLFGFLGGVLAARWLSRPKI